MISSIIFIMLTLTGLGIIDAGVRPTLIAIAKTETQRIGTLAINDAVSGQFLDNTDMDDLVELEKNEEGEVTSVQFNSVIYNRVLQETTESVQNYLNDIEHGRSKDNRFPKDVDVNGEGAVFSEDGIIHMIPLGQATNNALLAHLGPRIPVRLSAIGAVKSNLKENILDVGINNTYMSISVEIEADVQIVIPFATATEVVKTSIPVGMILIPGEVPEFYGGESGTGTGGMTPAVIQRPDGLDDLDLETNN